MSSDPIEVLRRVADELRRADALASKSDKIDRLKVIGRAADNNLSVILSALASLSAPKPESAEAVGEVVLHDGLLYGRLISDLPVGSVLYTAPPRPETSAPQPPAETQRCTCPSGDGSLRWPCPAHPAGADTAPPRPEASEGQAQGGGEVVDYQRAVELIGDAYNAGTHGIGYSQQAADLFDARTAPPSAPFGECGCGKPVDYFDVMGRPSCNKRIRCSEQQASAPVGVEAIADKIENDRTYWRSEAVADLRALDQQPAPVAPVGVVDVDALAQEIRRVDGEHSLGASALAEALVPYLARTTLDQQPAADFDAWQKNPYTKVLMKSVDEDYVPKHGQQPAAVDEAGALDQERRGALRILWLVLQQAGGEVTIPAEALVSTDWARCEVERMDHPGTGTIRLVARTAGQQQGGRSDD